MARLFPGRTWAVRIEGDERPVTRERVVELLGGPPTGRVPLLFDVAEGLSQEMARDLCEWLRGLGVTAEYFDPQGQRALISGYDSRSDTLEHIATVQRFIGEAIADLSERASRHDASKLSAPEKSVFDEFTPKLRDSEYGSDEYKAFLEGMGEGLRHHYAANDHHPEHFRYGIFEMDLLQLVEMLADWKAATLRHADGDLRRSIEQNAERFGYKDHRLEDMLIATADRLGWL